MMPIFKVSILLAILILCSACEVVCVNPLSDQTGAKQDQRLFGRWHTVSDGSGDYMQFDKGLELTTNISVKPDKLAPGTTNPVFTCFTTTIGDYDFMNIVSNDPKDHGKGYLIIRYRLRNNRLTVWTMNDEKVRQKIAEGKLKGKSERAFGMTTITDTSQGLTELIQTSGDSLFEYFGEFEKSTGK
jgi:hypothetical protein